MFFFFNLVEQVVPWIEVLLHTLIDWMRTEGEEGREVNYNYHNGCRKLK